jgi:hypothetical protein
VPCFDSFLPLQQITILSSSIVVGGGDGGGGGCSSSSSSSSNDNYDDDYDNNNNNKRNRKCDHTQILSSKERNQVCYSYLIYFGHLKLNSALLFTDVYFSITTSCCEKKQYSLNL